MRRETASGGKKTRKRILKEERTTARPKANAGRRIKIGEKKIAKRT